MPENSNNLIQNQLPKNEQDRIKNLEKQIKKLKDADALNEILFEISNAVNTTPDLDDLYRSIHRSLNRLISIPNFFISILDRENNLIYFPYYADEEDDASSWQFRVFDEKSLTAKVILTEKPLFLDSLQLIDLMGKGHIVGTLPKIWMGVPLIINEVVIGVLAIQNYSDPNAYTKRDLEILISVSHQIAVAIERKRIHQALIENERRYRTLSERSHDIIMRFDSTLRHIYANPAVEQIGFKPEDLIGKTHKELHFPDNLIKIWEEAIQKVFDSQQVNKIEFKLPQGIWIDWVLSPEFASDDKVNSVITFARDITERKQMEIQNTCYDRINNIILNSSNIDQMLNGILDSMIDIFNCDRAYILFPCDPNARKFSVPFLRSREKWALVPGHDVDIDEEGRKIIEEVIGSTEPLIYDPITNRKIRDHIREVYFIKSQMVMAVFPNTGQAWEVGLHQCEEERVWYDEDSRLFKGICLRIADGLSNMLLLRELQQANSYIDNVFNSMPSILMGVNSKGIITQWNLQAKNDTGIDSVHAIGRYFYHCFPHLTVFKNTINEAIEEQKVIEKIKIPRLVNRKTIYENITIYPLKESDIKGAVIRMDDTTNQIQMEEMMIQSEKMLSVGGLAAGMAHEINNPLAGMMQNAQLIHNRLTQNMPKNIDAAQKLGTTMETIKSYMDKREILSQLNNVNEAGKRAAKIVQNMLSFARKAEGSKSKNNLPQLMEKTIELAKNDYDLKKRFDFNQIIIETNITTNFPQIYCESSKIQQVFLNIIKNGSEAMLDYNKKRKDDPRFQIQFKVEYQDQDTIQMGVVQIKDNGPGMSEDVRKRVFEPFYTTKSPNQGTGLGLSVAFFIIVEDHMGELSVISTPGQSTEFIIKLPIRD